MRVWTHLLTTFSPFNWVPTIFFWAQRGRRCTCTKCVLYLSGQYSRCITGLILWSSEWFISTWYFSWNVTFSVLSSCAWIIPTTVWNCFSTIASVATAFLCECVFLALVHIKTKTRNQRKVEDDMRLVLSHTQPRIAKLVMLLQSRSWH